MAATMIIKLIPWILVVVAAIICVILFLVNKNLKQAAQNLSETVSVSQSRNVQLRKAVDGVLLFQEEDERIQEQTKSNVQSLIKAKGEKSVKKELAIIRDTIISEYNRL